MVEELYIALAENFILCIKTVAGNLYIKALQFFINVRVFNFSFQCWRKFQDIVLGYIWTVRS